MSAGPHRRSTDLLVLVAAAVCGAVLYDTLPAGWPTLRAAVGLVVLLLPGYGLVSLAYPGRGGADEEPRRPQSSAFERWLLQSPGLAGVERLALSFAVALLGLPLAAGAAIIVAGRISPRPVLAVVVGFTVVAGVGAFVRRLGLPPEERYGVSLATLWAPLAGPTGIDTALNVLLAVAVLTAAGGFGYALLAPNEGESYTSFALLSENDDGELVAGSYPSEFEAGEPSTLTARAVNHEQRSQSYTVVVVNERVESGGGETTVLQRSVLRRFEFDLAPGESWQSQHEVTPDLEGENVRVRYLLYRGSPPEDVDPGSAYRDVYIWVDVQGAEGGVDGDDEGG